MSCRVFVWLKCVECDWPNWWLERMLNDEWCIVWHCMATHCVCREWGMRWKCAIVRAWHEHLWSPNYTLMRLRGGSDKIGCVYVWSLNSPRCVYAGWCPELSGRQPSSCALKQALVHKEIGVAPHALWSMLKTLGRGCFYNGHEML